MLSRGCMHHEQQFLGLLTSVGSIFIKKKMRVKTKYIKMLYSG